MDVCRLQGHCPQAVNGKYGRVYRCRCVDVYMCT